MSQQQLIARGYREGEKAAWSSIWTLTALGALELLIALYVNSVGLLADGVDSLSDAAIAFIIWWGLRLSRRRPDRYFHFGYYKLESLGALLASTAMIAIASLIIYRAWRFLQEPPQIKYPLLALASLAVAGGVSLYVAIRMRRIANAFGLTSLRVGAHNSIKDASGSFIVFGGVLLSALGFPWMDAVAAMIVAVYIYSVSYVAIREAGLILVDAFNAPEVLNQVRQLVKGIEGVSGIAQIRLRHLGPYITGRIAVAVDPNMSVTAAHEVAKRVEAALERQIGRLRDLAVYAVPFAPLEDPNSDRAEQVGA
jgi:cation diffusion facilitator family transporter